MQLLDDMCFIAFSLLNFVWPVLYLEHWKRRSATYAYRWGTIDVKDEQLMQPRPLFHVSSPWKTRVCRAQKPVTARFLTEPYTFIDSASQRS